ncbi:CelD/BcsL family acetyltransferase involved in cellulose biosynthesis [Novosphingobium sp. PhB165]|uniref:GNAT family N-acetyltransferase n=1 Tax=Novosphingobium sp. PhB165 TaxID=2485105 RepID=UPI0010527783|nr:GNAT family N-acetyltransferase [Novosphingobium sp. PhB165]TCM21829.1 CelD/BcsL family acetyltransferase involved in cellulose biosynthesis [Novosphingobium sp. PhB165]
MFTAAPLLHEDETGFGRSDRAASDDGLIACLPWRAMESEVDAWDALAHRASEPNPFFESWYLLPSLRHLGSSECVSILRFERHGRLAGLLPVVRSRRYYRWPVPNLAGWLHANAFLGTPLIERGAESAFWRALFDWTDRAPGTALFLHLREMPLEGPVHDGLMAARGTRAVETVHREERAVLHSTLSPDDYLEASLTGKKRKEMRRQWNRLAERGHVTVERGRNDDGLDNWARQFLALEAAGWKGKAGSALASHEGTARLFREALSGAAARGRLERLALRLDGRPIAMLATFLTPPGAFSYKTAFDEGFSRFSPGVLLQREYLDMLNRREIAWTDSCAAEDHPMIDHIWRERRAVGRLSIAIGGPLRRALFRRFVKAELARNPARPRP